MKIPYSTSELKTLREIVTAACQGGTNLAVEVRSRMDQFPGRTVSGVRMAAERIRNDEPTAQLQVVDGGTKPDNALDGKIKKALMASGQRMALIDLSDRFDVAPKAIRESIGRLQSEQHVLAMCDQTDAWIGSPASKTTSAYKYPIDTWSYVDSRVIRFGVVSDQHLCSVYQRLDVLQSIYDVFETEGIEVVYSPGNYLEGSASFNRQEILEVGIGRQHQYLMENYPRRTGIHTEFISGDDHEGWWVQREGVDLGAEWNAYASKYGRDDMVYIGHMEHDVVVPGPRGSTKIRLLHPGGGSSYAVSYTSQKIVESYSGGEKPQILIVGHYHKAELLYNRNVWIVQAGTTQDQSSFMRKKRLAAHVGGWICEAHLADDGSVRRFKGEFLAYYDRGYHEKEWRYGHEHMEAAA